MQDSYHATRHKHAMQDTCYETLLCKTCAMMMRYAYCMFRVSGMCIAEA